MALLFYGYATGVFSSRKLEQATHDSVAFRFISGDSHPDHDTIALFRKRFLPELEGLLADAGYFSEANVGQCEAAGITPYISDHRQRHNAPFEERFAEPPACPDDADAVTKMAHRLSTKEGKAVYAKRKSTVETVFGIVKEVMGFRRFHLRRSLSMEMRHELKELSV